MKRILNKEMTIEKQHNQSNIPIPFTINQEYEKLIIEFQYGPSHATENESYPLIKTALKKYFPNDKEVTTKDISHYSPIENLVTLSVSYNNAYLGARHTKERKQSIFISKEKSSLGFPKHGITSGAWEVQLNVHCIASEKIAALVSIYVEREGIE